MSQSSVRYKRDSSDESSQCVNRSLRVLMKLLPELTPSKDGPLLPVGPVSAAWKAFLWSVNRSPDEAMAFSLFERWRVAQP